MSLPIIFISGPTAIGKSELALRLAKKVKGEIINADSMQVYTELKILTARPTTKDYNQIPHHLYGHVPGINRYNVSKWCNEIISILNQNKEKKIISILVGGTGMYIETFLKGISNIPNVSETFKKKSNLLMNNIGLENFYNEVNKIDPLSCKNISKNDSQRLKRIWEVHFATGKPLSYWIKEKNKVFFYNNNFYVYLFLPKREEIYNRANKRFKKMIENGAIDEVKKLLSLKIDPSLPIMKAHGVREISKYLSGSISLEQCISLGQQITRNYAKRQITWWKSSKLKNCTTFNDFPLEFDLKNFDFLENFN